MTTNFSSCKIKVLIAFLLFTTGIVGQNAKIDSLMKMLEMAKDTTRMNTLNELAYSIYYDNSDSALFLTDQAYLESKKINYTKGMAYACGIKMTVYIIRGEFEKAIGYQKERISLLENQRDNKKLIYAYRSLAWAMWKMGNYMEAIKNYDKSLSLISLQEEQKESRFRILIDKGILYKEMGQFAKTYDLYTLAIKEMEAVKNKKKFPIEMKTALYDLAILFKEVGDDETSKSYYEKANEFKFNAADEAENTEFETSWKMYVHLSMSNFDSALYYQKKLNEIYRKQPFARDLIVTEYNGMLDNMTNGEIFAGLQQYDTAIDLVIKAQPYFKQRKLVLNVLSTSYTLGQSYFKKGDYSKATRFTNELISQAENSNLLIKLRDGYQLLSEIYEKTGDKDKANFYYRKYADLKDQIKTDEFKQKLQLYKAKEKEKQKLGAIEQLKKEKQWLSIGIILLATTVASFLAFIWVQRKSIARKKLLEQQDLALKEAENEKRIVGLEMLALRSQMNPHFIFNCLNSINRFVLRNDTEAASGYLTKFSKLMRMVLENSKQTLIPLEEEVKCLELYIQMEQFRCKNAFTYYIKYHDGVNTEEAMIPPLLLQPFVENAIWHGVNPKEGDGKIGIEFFQKEEALYCVIRDNGIGRKKASELKSQLSEHHKSMGLQITKERLAIIEEQKSKESPVEIEDIYDENGKAAGTKVTIRIFSLPAFEELKSSLNL